MKATHESESWGSMKLLLLFAGESLGQADNVNVDACVSAVHASGASNDEQLIIDNLATSDNSDEQVGLIRPNKDLSIWIDEDQV